MALAVEKEEAAAAVREGGHGQFEVTTLAGGQAQLVGKAWRRGQQGGGLRCRLTSGGCVYRGLPGDDVNGCLVDEWVDSLWTGQGKKAEN
jgi:hypothetical protein